LSSGIQHQQFSNRYCVSTVKNSFDTDNVCSVSCLLGVLRTEPVGPVKNMSLSLYLLFASCSSFVCFSYNKSDVKFCVHFQSRGKQKKRLVLTRRQKTQLALSQYVFKCNASFVCHKHLTLLSSSAKLTPRSEQQSASIS